MKQNIVKTLPDSAKHRAKRYTRLTDAELKKATALSSALHADRTEAQHKRSEIASIIQHATDFMSRLKQQL